VQARPIIGGNYMSHSRCALTIVFIFLFHTAVPAQYQYPVLPSVALDKNDPELRAILTEIEAEAEKARLEAKYPSLAIAIVHDQDVLLAKGFGYADLEKKIPADTQTVYRLASVTKVFTALALMQLRDAGKLHLDDPIEKYLPELKIKSRFPDARPPTFRQVAAHYSGLPYEPPMLHEYQITETGEFPPVEEQLKTLKDVEMVVPAMSQYWYSNLGYNILGLAVSRIAEQPYDNYVASHTLKPLGMNDTGFALTEQMKSHFAVGYKAARPDGTFERSTYPKYGVASGMLYSNVDDMAKFLSSFFREGPRGGKQVLGSSSLREMIVPVAVSTDIRRNEKGKPLSLWQESGTIGFSANPFEGEQINYKPGGMQGFSSMLYINYPRKMGMILLTNTQTQPFWLGYNLLKKLTATVMKSLERTQDKMLKEALPEWQKYTGRYVITDPEAVRTLAFSEIDISIVNQKLAFTVPKSPGSALFEIEKRPLVPYSKGVFYVDGGSFFGNRMTFESNQDGSMVLKWRNHVFKRQP
jgi:CubicO group peptidase (beta-lactamase class C family)